MKLLVITQKADRTDPILGFFHRWLEEFSRQVEVLTVIAQSIGEHDLPTNVRVVSLGKERGRSRIMQIFSFWKFIWGLRASYDCVLVHMTPIWVLLGWPLWFLLRKPIFLWYEVRRGSPRLSLALLCVKKVFSATVQGLPRPHRKQIVLGHGIDTDMFAPGKDNREEGLAVAVGRLTRSKRYDVILRAFVQVPALHHLQIAGGTITAKDQKEKADIERLMSELTIAARVGISWVKPEDMPALLCRADLVLHACIGGLDKVVLDAMACGTPVVSTSSAAEGVLPAICLATSETMADHALKVLALPLEARAALSRDLRERVVQGHGLPRLIGRLVQHMQ